MAENDSIVGQQETIDQILGNCKMNEEQTDIDNDLTKDINTIGQFVIITGDINGKEDILIEGTVEGNIIFPKFSVVVGKNGRIHADITAGRILIEGEVKGDLHATESINIKASGRVVGDIRAPQISLNEGCQFKGAVDMGEIHAHLAGDSPRPKLTGNKKPLTIDSEKNTPKPAGTGYKTFPSLQKKDP